MTGQGEGQSKVAMDGREWSFVRELSGEDISDFGRITGDQNPLHFDPQFAETTELGRPVVHGAYLIGLVSRLAGMNLPGPGCLILSMNIRFPKALYYPTTILVKGRVSHFDPSQKIGVLNIVIVDQQQGWNVLEGKVNFALVSHRGRTPAEAIEDERLCKTQERDRVEGGENVPPSVLVTGGTGEIGSKVVSLLRNNYSLVCFTRKARKDENRGIRYLEIDLDQEKELESVLAGMSPRDFHGIVHMSVPPVRRGQVSESLDELRRQWRHAVEVPILLSKWAMRENSSVRRLVLFGSTAGTKLPDPHLGAYSLAKASMEHLVRLLAWDLAHQKATVNAILPGFTRFGVNRGVLEHSQKIVAALTATGRLTEPDDVAHLVDYLLSDDSGQINGTTLTIDGCFSR